ncbi:hypothetical protein MPNT_240008 [Candidatus Methylacidithermus pantelleriae]|uniref:Uncharacterized protein n=1 Tax=Candidatus Methylacidithermus pantelleriae TaxID=2744239 RepID=A0A8J2BL03_9BACT|nr:hypothetical protein MPNT_240008 [Candidatus Methylacidithermus pantelleriae]
MRQPGESRLSWLGRRLAFPKRAQVVVFARVRSCWPAVQSHLGPPRSQDRLHLRETGGELSRR